MPPKLSNKENRADQIQLQEYYYGTYEGERNILHKESKGAVYFKCFLCSSVMRSNTEVMEHMIKHVPPQVPGQSEAPVCRYCCTAFSSNHQMTTHIDETHSDFGNSTSNMVVCGICEQKFGNSTLLINHLLMTHCSSEMPYRCETCGYRSSSNKNIIDHYYKVHEKGEGLQCPYCLKVIQFTMDGNPSTPSVHAYLLHMQRHVLRREQGRGNKCSKCCLWFNQRTSLRNHQRDHHDTVFGSKVTPFSGSTKPIMISKQRTVQIRRVDLTNSPTAEFRDEKVKKWSTGRIKVNAPSRHLPCQECEEDIDEVDHYSGEQKCSQCHYVTCCWRAFNEHQQQIHNERPMTSLVVPSPLINIPLDKKMRCLCGFSTTDGNQLATHLVKCKKISAYPMEDSAPSGIIDSLGLVPKVVSEAR